MEREEEEEAADPTLSRFDAISKACWVAVVLDELLLLLQDTDCAIIFSTPASKMYLAEVKATFGRMLSVNLFGGCKKKRGIL